MEFAATSIARSPAEFVSTESVAHIKFAVECINHCINQHGKCSRIASTSLPTRLLAITRTNGGSFQIRLHITTEDERVERIQYCALSYCWGGVEDVLKLLQDNVEDFKNGIPLQDLPRCYKDAIKLTYRIGVRYLWIDALCIIQDQNEDFTKESLIMGDVYAGASCTIVATNTENPNETLYSRRNPRLDQPCIISRSKTHALVVLERGARGSGESILTSKRGWCMQEGMLSKRVLLVGKEVRFCCDTSSILESLLLDEDFTELVDEREDGMRDRQGAREYYTCPLTEVTVNDKIGPAYVHAAWARLVLQYTNRKFGKQGDMLLALAGVAQRIKASFSLTYSAGLWLQTLPYGLLWTVETSSHSEGPDRCDSYRAPTWSWASCVGRIRQEVWRSHRPLPCDILINLRHDPLDSTQTGAVLDGELIARGPLQRIPEFREMLSSSVSPFRTCGHTRGFYFTMHDGHLYIAGRFWLDFKPVEPITASDKWELIDHNERPPPPASRRVYFWPLIHEECCTISERKSLPFSKKHSFQEIKGLVLMQRGEYFERIGLGLVTTEFLKKGDCLYSIMLSYTGRAFNL